MREQTPLAPEQRKERFVEFHRLLAAYNRSRFSPDLAVREAALEELELFAVGPRSSASVQEGA